VAPQSTDRVVQTVGKQSQVIDAVREVITLTRDTPIKGAIHNYDPMNFDRVYADEYGGYGTGSGSTRPSQRGNNRNGGGGAGGAGAGGAAGGNGGGFSAGGARGNAGGRGGADRFGQPEISVRGYQIGGQALPATLHAEQTAAPNRGGSAGRNYIQHLLPWLHAD